MKHKEIIIKLDDLETRIFGDSDNFTLGDALGFEGEELERIEGYAVVGWPEHVINPRYNSDANYCHYLSLAVAICANPDALLYGGEPIAPRKDKTITITIEGGCLQDVKGLPDGYNYELIDLDCLEEYYTR